MDQNLQKHGPTKPSSFEVVISGILLQYWNSRWHSGPGMLVAKPGTFKTSTMVDKAHLLYMEHLCKHWWPYVLWCLFSLQSPSPSISSFWGAWEEGKRLVFLPVHISGSALSSAFSILTSRPSQLWKTTSDPQSKQLFCPSLRYISMYIPFLPDWVILDVSLNGDTLVTLSFGAMPITAWNLHRWYRQCVGTETHSRDSSLHILYGRGWWLRDHLKKGIPH